VLRRRLIDRLDGIAAVRIVSPRDDALGAGIVAFEASGMPALALQQRLAEAEAPASAPLAGRTLRVRTRVIGEYDYGWMRLSPHVYTSESEIDTVTAMIADILQRGPA
jgi:selenocysteine lyase/cysteine desulfurase